MALCTWSPKFYCATIPPCLRASVPSRNQKIVPPRHHPTLPFTTLFHRAICHQHAVAVLPWHQVLRRDTYYASVTPGAPLLHLVRHRDSWCAIMTPGAPQLNRHTSVHPRTWHTSIRIWQLSIIPPYILRQIDPISPYSLLLKIAMTTLMGFLKGP